MNDPSAEEIRLFERALAEARSGLAEGGIPIGAALAAGGEVLAVGRNERVQREDPIAHGEMSCLRNAGRQKSYRGLTLFTTLSPCQMCTGAILLFGIPRIVVGEARTFAGDLSVFQRNGVEVVLLNDERCVSLMEEFQQRYPTVWAEDIGVIPA
jgi:creatinine deaminase